jgi:hypothetical protein
LPDKCESSCQLAQKLTFVHAVFERFVAIDEDHRNFVGELTAQLLIRIDINFMPGEPAPPVQFGQGLFDNLAKMTTLSRINDYLAQDGHERSLAIVEWFCQHSSVKLGKLITCVCEGSVPDFCGAVAGLL